MSAAKLLQTDYLFLTYFCRIPEGSQTQYWLMCQPYFSFLWRYISENWIVSPGIHGNVMSHMTQLYVLGIYYMMWCIHHFSFSSIVALYFLMLHGFQWNRAGIQQPCWSSHFRLPLIHPPSHLTFTHWPIIYAVQSLCKAIANLVQFTLWIFRLISGKKMADAGWEEEGRGWWRQEDGDKRMTCEGSDIKEEEAHAPVSRMTDRWQCHTGGLPDLLHTLFGLRPQHIKTLSALI